jgi:hypothetical protein
MFVSIEGYDNEGVRLERSWHLIAEGEDGPFIPSMAVEAIVRRSMTGFTPKPGARPATGDIDIQEYRKVFKNRKIVMGCRDALPHNSSVPLYQRLLGDAWTSLPEPIRELHNCDAHLRAQGLAVVERGTSPLSRAISTLFRFPADGKDIPIEVDFRVKNRGEVWRRTFGGRAFSSTQSEGRGRSDRLLSEQFGPFTFGLALVVQAERLHLVVRRWSFLRLPLPMTLAPSGDSFEFVADNRFCFNVEIRHAMTGLIVRYRGWLEVK